MREIAAADPDNTIHREPDLVDAQPGKAELPKGHTQKRKNVPSLPDDATETPPLLDDFISDGGGLFSVATSIVKNRNLSPHGDIPVPSQQYQQVQSLPVHGDHGQLSNTPADKECAKKMLHKPSPNATGTSLFVVPTLLPPQA